MKAVGDLRRKDLKGLNPIADRLTELRCSPGCEPAEPSWPLLVSWMPNPARWPSDPTLWALTPPSCRLAELWVADSPCRERAADMACE